MCKGGAHVDIPKDIEFETWEVNGNPPVGYDPRNLPWCTNCPVAAMSLLLKLQYRLHPMREHGLVGRIYRKFSTAKRAKDRHMGKSSSGDPVRDAIEWFKAQGVDREFDHNAGRPSLGRWLGQLGVPFGPGFQYHGDLPDTWGGHYQTDKFRKDGHKNRQQSRDPDTALEGLRTFAAWLGLGIDKRPPLSRLEQFMVGIMEGQDRILGGSDQSMKARRICRGVASDSSDEEFEVRKPRRRLLQQNPLLS